MSQLLGRVLKSTVVVSGIVLLCKVLGLLEKVILGAVFGSREQKYQMDIYLATVTVVVMFYDIVRYSLIPALLPALCEEREKHGEAAAWELTSTFVNLMVPVLTLVIIVILIFPKGLVGLLFPELSGGYADPATKMRLATDLLRITLAGGVFLVAGGIACGVLNSYNRFAAAALGDLTFKAVGMIPLVVLALFIYGGHADFMGSSGIKLVSAGVMLGCVGLLAVQLVALGKKLRLFRLRFRIRTATARRVLRSAGPLFVFAVLYFGRRIIDIQFAFGMTEGAYSGLDFSYRIIELPFRLIVEPMGYVVFPFLAVLATKRAGKVQAKGDEEELVEVLMASLRGLLLILLPLSIGLFLLRRPAVIALFQYGRFENVELTVAPLMWYALGIVAIGMDVILTRAYFAMKDILTPVGLEVLAFVGNLALILALKGKMESAGIALAFTLTRTVKAAVLFALLKHGLGTIQGRENALFLAKVAAAAIGMGIAVYWTREFLGSQLDAESKVGRFGMLLGPAAVGGIVYVASLFVMGAKEIRSLLAIRGKAPGGHP